jgi:hypothetical protein
MNRSTVFLLTSALIAIAFLFLVFSLDSNNKDDLIDKVNSLENDLTLQDKLENPECLPGSDCDFDLVFLRLDMQGEVTNKGSNNVVIFDPKSPNLDFKVNVGLDHELYAKDEKGNYKKEYSAQNFRRLVSREDSKSEGREPVVAINADYIDKDGKPQGLNISRGVEYSGVFKDYRSSFGVSGGVPSKRVATIDNTKRGSEILNYNVVGGNGRFYKDGSFEDICEKLGEYACYQSTERSMVAITKNGYVIFLVNDKESLLPSEFDDILGLISDNYKLGEVQDAMLFDGGMSPSLYYNGKFYVEGSGPIGSIFLIYRK